MESLATSSKTKTAYSFQNQQVIEKNHKRGVFKSKIYDQPSTSPDTRQVDDIVGNKVKDDNNSVH